MKGRVRQSRGQDSFWLLDVLRLDFTLLREQIWVRCVDDNDVNWWQGVAFLGVDRLLLLRPICTWHIISLSNALVSHDPAVNGLETLELYASRKTYQLRFSNATSMSNWLAHLKTIAETASDNSLLESGDHMISDSLEAYNQMPYIETLLQIDEERRVAEGLDSANSKKPSISALLPRGVLDIRDIALPQTDTVISALQENAVVDTCSKSLGSQIHKADSMFGLRDEANPVARKTSVLPTELDDTNLSPSDTVTPKLADVYSKCRFSNTSRQRLVQKILGSGEIGTMWRKTKYKRSRLLRDALSQPPAVSATAPESRTKVPVQLEPDNAGLGTHSSLLDASNSVRDSVTLSSNDFSSPAFDRFSNYPLDDPVVPATLHQDNYKTITTLSLEALFSWPQDNNEEPPTASDAHSAVSSIAPVSEQLAPASRKRTKVSSHKQPSLLQAQGILLELAALAGVFPVTFLRVVKLMNYVAKEQGYKLPVPFGVAMGRRVNIAQYVVEQNNVKREFDPLSFMPYLYAPILYSPPYTQPPLVPQAPKRDVPSLLAFPRFAAKPPAPPFCQSEFQSIAFPALRDYAPKQKAKTVQGKRAPQELEPVT